MIYLDNGATSFPKPREVVKAVELALARGTNPGRGGYGSAMAAADFVYDCREAAARLFHCVPEQVVLTANCTHGLNIAIESLVKPEGRVLVSGFEHNAVMRPLYARNCRVRVAGRELFCWDSLLEDFRRELRQGVDAAVFTHVSNVFGYILPVREMAAMCREAGVPFILDAAQSAGSLEVDMQALGADFIAMPGHKGLLGPQGTGLLLCAQPGTPLLYGGTGSQSKLKTMPQSLPERLEAGTVNVPGAAGLAAGIGLVERLGLPAIFRRGHRQMKLCARGLEERGFRVFSGPHQAMTLSFQGRGDCEELASALASRGIAVRAGLHCAPLAHESAGTLQRGTVRVSFGHDAAPWMTRALLGAAEEAERKFTIGKPLMDHSKK